MDRVKIAGTKTRAKMIEQCDGDGRLVKTHNSLAFANKELNIYICLSYFSQNNFVFKPIDSLRKLNRHKIIQMTLDGDVIKIYDDTVQNAAKSLELTRMALNNCLNGYTKTCAGFKQTYKK